MFYIFTEEEKQAIEILSDPVKWITATIGEAPRWYQVDMLRDPHKRKVFRLGRRCVVAGTPILMEDGSWKSIEQIKVGDKVLTRDDEGIYVSRDVILEHRNGVKETYRVKLENGLYVDCTSNHPFLIQETWKSIEDGLKVGDLAVTFEHGEAPIASISYLGQQETFDIGVEEYHNYIANGIVVHNTGKCISEFSNVNTEKGYITAKDLSEMANKPKILTYDEYTQETYYTNAYFIWSNGIKPVYKISTASGKSTYATDNHPFLTKGIWKELSDIHAGDTIATLDAPNEEVTEVLYVGEHETYDLTVPETSTLVSDDIISHNTWVMCAHMLWYAFTHKNAALVVAAPYENQITIIFDQLRRFIHSAPELISSVQLDRRNPQQIQLKNGSTIRGFTAGTRSGAAGGSLRGQGADFIYMDECLDGETLIATPNGEIPIKDLSIGDEVYSLGEGLVVRKITNKKCTGIKPVYKLTTESGKELICTDNHPILTEDGYVEAYKVRKVNKDDKVTSFLYLDSREVYNLTVEGEHNYIANGIVTHNCDYMTDDDFDTIYAISLEAPKRIGVWVASTPTGRRGVFYQLCFLPGTKIMTPNNYLVNIEDIKIGDRVIGISGNCEEVTQTYHSVLEDDIHTISTWHLPFNTICTPNHEIMTDGGWKEAKDITPDDYILVPIPRQTGFTTIPIELNKKELRRLEMVEYQDNIINTSKHFKVDRKLISNLRKNCNKYGKELGVLDKRKRDNILLAREFINTNSKEFARLAGYYLAEGCILQSKEYISGIQFTFNIKEEQYASEVVATIKKLFNLECKVKQVPERNTLIILCYSSAIGIAFRAMFGEKEYKKIPPELMYGPYSLDLVETLIDGDGYRRKDGFTVLGLTAQQLALQTYYILLSHEQRASVCFSPKAEKRDIFTISKMISNRVTCKFVEGEFYVKVKENSHGSYFGSVYNLETNISSTYVANFLGVHNCTDKSRGWKEYHYPTTVNPEWDASMEKELRAMFSTEVAWEHEVLANFGSEVIGVFRKEYIDRAKADYEYFTKRDNLFSHVTIGVDWDKYANATQIIVVGYNISLQRFQVLIRVEIPKGEFTLSNAVQRIIQLNETYNPDFIYVDRGFGEYQLEVLHIYGKENPDSGLEKKVKGWAFGSSYEVRNPVTKESVKTPLKPFMVNQLVYLMEQDFIILNDNDEMVWKQMEGYSVTRFGQDGRPVFTSENEHSVDALMLAILAMQLEFPHLSNIIKEQSVARTMAGTKVHYTDPFKQIITFNNKRNDKTSVEWDEPGAPPPKKVPVGTGFKKASRWGARGSNPRSSRKSW